MLPLSLGLMHDALHSKRPLDVMGAQSRWARARRSMGCVEGEEKEVDRRAQECASVCGVAAVIHAHAGAQPPIRGGAAWSDG
ncbi:hypothetical protein APR52_17800 [Variovorax paradoxus]|nr:hypothetical protein APR52_17800 [Variovorax paradoxus]